MIIPISLTGAALVWHDWLEAKLEPQRHQVIGPASLPPSAYAAAARGMLSADERVASIRFNGDGGPVTVTASKPAKSEGGRPERTNVWLQPLSGEPPVRVTDLASLDIVRGRRTPDGTSLIVARGSAQTDAYLVSNFR